jgi:Fur family transcriptional regulator, ferric uptake regulator
MYARKPLGVTWISNGAPQGGHKRTRIGHGAVTSGPRADILGAKVMQMPADRQTKQRQAIRDVMEESGSPLSPREILDGAQRHVAGMGMATVYRTLKLLAEEKLVAMVEIPGEAPRYELSGKGHHHHFYCRTCGKVYEVDGCPGNLASLAPAGFKLDGHELVLFGRCKPCVR